MNTLHGCFFETTGFCAPGNRPNSRPQFIVLWVHFEVSFNIYITTLDVVTRVWASIYSFVAFLCILLAEPLAFFWCNWRSISSYSANLLVLLTKPLGLNIYSDFIQRSIFNRPFRILLDFYRHLASWKN